MVQYLGGNILPYIDIGKSIDVSYVSDDANDGYKSYLLLVGNKFVSSNLQDAKDTYISYDWVVWLSIAFLSQIATRLTSML